MWLPRNEDHELVVGGRTRAELELSIAAAREVIDRHVNAHLRSMALLLGVGVCGLVVDVERELAPGYLWPGLLILGPLTIYLVALIRAGAQLDALLLGGIDLVMSVMYWTGAAELWMVMLMFITCGSPAVAEIAARWAIGDFRRY